MADCNGTRPTGQFPSADLSPKAVAAQVRQLQPLGAAFEPVVARARWLAAEALKLAEAHRKAEVYVSATVRADQYDNGGDLVNAVGDKLGLRVVSDVLYLMPALLSPRVRRNDCRKLERRARQVPLAPPPATLARIEAIEARVARISDMLGELEADLAARVQAL